MFSEIVMILVVFSAALSVSHSLYGAEWKDDERMPNCKDWEGNDPVFG
jgi:hypothetical protein